MEVCKMAPIEELTRQCCDMKIKALEIGLNAGSFGAHIGGSFSLMEILTALYEVANITDGIVPERDRIILSKGHGALALYTILWKKGFISEEALNSFDTPETNFHVHPHKNNDYAIEMSTGSLGLGFPYAVGLAISCKKKELDNRVFVILGDGECDEGLVWEAAMSSSHYHLDNLTVIIDANGFQVDGKTKSVMDNSCLSEKFKSFGFEVMETDGHDIAGLISILSKKNDKPTAVIANTVKAHGISFLENNKNSHQCCLSQKKYEQAVKEIKDAYGVE